MRPIVANNWFLWNIDQSVGKNASNGNSADISLVQWYFVQLATRPAGVNPAHLSIYRAVRVTGSCSGRDDDPLVVAILTWQNSEHADRAHSTVDGHVSVAQGTGFYAAAAPFMILMLSDELAHWFPNVYPRLDLIPGCPSAIANAVRAAIPHG